MTYRNVDCIYKTKFQGEHGTVPGVGFALSLTFGTTDYQALNICYLYHSVNFPCTQSVRAIYETAIHYCG